MPITDLQLQSLAQDAMQRAQAGDYAGAEPLLAEVVTARPNSGQALHLLGQARLKLGRLAEAREPLERAAKFLPKEVAVQVTYAGCLTVLGEHEASLWALDRAAKVKPGDPVIAHNEGRVREALGRLEEAERSYDDALAAEHRLMPSLIARAGLLEARGDWMGALADLDMVLFTRPDDARLRLQRGELLLQQGDWMRGLPDDEARLGTLAALPEGPTIRRGDPLDGFGAAHHCVPHLLLGWSADAPPPLRPHSEPQDRLVGDDTWETRLAACRGVPTTIHLPTKADWLWGARREGPSHAIGRPI